MLVKKNKKDISKSQKECETILRNLATLPDKELYVALASSDNGLDIDTSDERREEIGKNIIITPGASSIFKRLIDAFINPFNIVLFIIAITTFITDVILADKADYTTAIIIIILILASSLIAFIQGEKSNKAALNLTSMISNKADVLRGKKFVEISIEDIVPGDIVKLSSGDMIPGDVRFLTTNDTFISQSALTGESAPVEKFSSSLIDINASITDMSNIGFMGTDIISGSATAIILTTGNNTYFGAMAQSLSGDKAKNNFERGVDSVSRLLIAFMLIMVPIIFFVNGFTKNDWGSALMFAITMAVGLTPEMLPMIMTSTLAKGAVSMSKRKVIVKSLSSIQTFGEMDILCTDITGTLTEDKIILEKYMDVMGRDDSRILRHAYLNSHFQTGLKNLIDLAIINRAKENKLAALLKDYKCVDEIPFDFARRRMSVVLLDKNEKSQLITKGAVDEIISICKYVELDGKVELLNEKRIKKAMEVYEKHNNDGLRIVAIAQKNEVPSEGNFTVKDEEEMVLIGFVGFLDPPKESAKAAILALKENGVRTVVLTGDSEGVAIKVCGKVGVNNEICLNGKDVEAMTDAQLVKAIRTCDLFAKLSPVQKQRVVQAFQSEGHTVGYMGDGINDAPALRQADVGISVDSGVDIAKETADIILLKKDLIVLDDGVIEGRKTFGNIIKYIKMAASGNFGNMISIIIASIFLPFLPLLPIHILMQNLLCDFSQMGIAFDNVDKEYVEVPRKWDTNSIRNFMFFMGPLSSIFDILCFCVLWWIIGANTMVDATLFQTGWFIFGTLSQILIVFMIRTKKFSIFKNRASLPLIVSSLIVGLTALLIVYDVNIATWLDFTKLPYTYLPWLGGLLILYCIGLQLFKVMYIKVFKSWL